MTTTRCIPRGTSVFDAATAACVLLVALLACSHAQLHAQGEGTYNYVQSDGSSVMVFQSHPSQGNPHYREQQNTWIDSFAKSTIIVNQAGGKTPGRKCVFHNSVNPSVAATPGPASARFMPQFPARGHYHAYITWPDWGNATPVRVTIGHAGGQTVKWVQQNGFGFNTPSNAHMWVPLGDYDFDPGENSYIEVAVIDGAMPVDPRQLGQVYADAVCFCQKPVMDSVLPFESAAVAPPQGGTAFTQSVSPQGASPQPAAASPPTMPVPSSTAPAPTLQWLDNIRDARIMSAEQSRKLLIFFRSDESLLSNHYEQTVFADPAVRQALAKYVLLRLDHQQNIDTATKLLIFRAGGMVIFDSRGDGLDIITNKLPTEEFLARLRKLL